MPWLLAALGAVVVYFVGKTQCWWSCKDNFTCDVESDMPDNLKTQVLTQAASATSSATLRAFAVTLYQAGYIQSSYCLAYRAWVMDGSHGTAPIPPTAQDIAAAQATRAAANASAASQVASAASQPHALGGLNPSDATVPSGGGMPADILAALTNAAVANLGQQPGAGQPYVSPAYERR